MNSASLKLGYITVPSSTIAAVSKERMHEKVTSPSQFLPLTFPATRSILWDHRSIGKSCVVQLCTRRHPVIFLKEQTLRIIQRLVQEATSSELVFWLIGSVSTSEPDESNVNITIATVDNSGKRSKTIKEITAKDLKPGEIIIPCTVSVNGTKPMCSEDDYLNSLQVVQNRCRSCGPIDVAHLLSIRANCSYERIGDNVNVHIDFNAVFPGMAFRVTPINPLPIVPTALSKNLGSPLSISEVQGEPKSGFLTMDHTRKLVLVFDCDRKIQTLPLVGIWVSGVANVDDPFVWASLLRYTCGANLKDRVCLPPEPFLVVLYSVLCSKPEFYECTLEGGMPRLDYTLVACHDVIQLNKNALGASELPIEMELLPVIGGGQRMDVFYSALETFRNKVRAEDSKNTAKADTAEEIVPRTFPVPTAIQTMNAQPSVPEVTLLDGLNTSLPPTQQQRPQTVTVSSVESIVRSDSTACQLQSTKPHRPSKAEEVNTVWPVRAPPAQFTYPGSNPPHPNPPHPNPPHLNPAPPASVHFQSQPQFAAPVSYAFPQNVYQPFPFQRPVMISQEGHYVTSLPASFGYPPQQPYGVNPNWAFSSGPLVTNVVTNSFRPSRPQSILRNPVPKLTGNQTRTNKEDWYQPTNSLPSQVAGLFPVRPGLTQRPPNPRPVSCVPSTFAATVQRPNTEQAVSAKRQSLNEASQMPNTLRSASNRQENRKLAEQQSRAKPQTVAVKPASFCLSPVNSHFQLDPPGSAHNSGSTDSGLQFNDSSGLLESPVQSVPVLEKKFMQIILQQQAKINELERQLHDVKANQMKEQPELADNDASKSACPAASKSSSHETCSVGINTTQIWPVEPSGGDGGRQSLNSSRAQQAKCDNPANRSHSTDATPPEFRNGQARIQKGKSENSAKKLGGSDSTPYGFRDGQGAKGGQSKQSMERITSPREELASFASVENVRRNTAHCRFEAEVDANDMSFGDIHLSQIQIPNLNDDCFLSTMILDMPDCTFFSLERDSTSHDTERNESPRNCQSTSPHEQDHCSPVRPSRGFELDTENSQSRRMTSDELQRLQREVSSKASGRVAKCEKWHLESEPCATALKDSRNFRENGCRKETVDEFDSRSQRSRYLGIDSFADDQTDVTTYSVDQSSLDQTFYPKINYVSMMLDNCSPEMSMGADALAMKYLSDDQLSELAKLRALSGPGRQKVVPETKGRSDISMYGAQLNQMSFASQKYLERHGLLGNAMSSKESEPCKRVTERESSSKRSRHSQEEIGELNVQDFIQNLSKTKPRNSLGGGYNDSGSAANRNGTLGSSVRSNSDGESFGERSSTPIHNRTAPGQPPIPKRNGEQPITSGQMPQRRETYDGCPTPAAQKPAWMHCHATPVRTPAQPVTPSEPLPSSSKIRQRNVVAVDRTLDYTADVVRDSDEDPTDERQQDAYSPIHERQQDAYSPIHERQQDAYSPIQKTSADRQRTSHERMSPTLEKVLDVKMIRELPKLL